MAIDVSGDDNSGDFSDGGWTKKEALSFKDICINRINKCGEEWSKDIRKGGNYKIQDAKGNVVPVWFPDQREININATETLYDLLYWYFDDECKNKMEELKEEMDKLPAWRNKQYEIIKKQFKGQPKANENVMEEVENRTTLYTLSLYREMWRELIQLFKRKNELSGKRKIGYGL